MVDKTALLRLPFSDYNKFETFFVKTEWFKYTF